MASKLLNVLQEIEEGRKECIDVLGEKGLQVNPNADFKEISEDIDELSWHVYNDDPTAPPNQVGNPWGYTRLTDPTLWKRPTDWPDLETIFKSYTNFTVPFDSDSTHDFVVTPVCALLLKNDPSDTLNIEFAPRDTSPYPYNRSNLQPGDLILAYTTMNYRSRMAYRLYFSDTDEYVQFQPKTDATSTDQQNTSEFAQHTWDSSRDIVVGDDHYRWIIICEGCYSSTSVSLAVEATQLKVHEFLFVKSVGTSGSYTNVPDCIEHIKGLNNFIESPFNEAVSNIAFNSANNNNTRDFYKVNAYCIEWEPSSTLTYNSYSFPLNQYEYFPRLQILIHPYWSYLTQNTSSRQFEDTTKIPHLKYVKLKKYQLENRTGNNSYGLSYNTLNNSSLTYASNVMYLECDAEAQATETLCTCLPCFPNMVESNVLEYVTTVTSGYPNSQYGFTGMYGIRKGELFLPNVTTVSDNYFFNYCKHHTLRLPKYEANPTFSQNGFQKSFIKKIVLGTVSNPNPNNNIIYGSNYMDLRVVELPYLTSLDGAVSYNSNSSNQYQLCSTTPMYLSVSALEEMSNINGLNCVCWNYINLKQNFKFSMNLDRVIHLKKECVLDIFNKCAQLGEGETYTITLSPIVKAQLTSEEIAIATNKGWTVA